MNTYHQKIACVCLYLLSFQMQAQVGINTTSPNAQLEIKATDAGNPDPTDGILIPKVDVFPVVNPTADQDGMLVYLTTDVGPNSKGFYYWDNATVAWIAISKDNKAWSVDGNSGTSPATNFIGTRDNSDVIFKRNNISSGLLSNFNSAFGVDSLNKTTSTGAFNSAFGSWVLKSNTTGAYNTAMGETALASNTTGNYNTAQGISALSENVTGSDNVAFGAYALLQNVSGNENVGVGSLALSNNISGSNLTAVGSKTLVNNTSGIENTAVGYESLWSNTIGNYNTATGYHSLRLNDSGLENTAFGAYAVATNSSGNYNTALGTSALRNNTTASSNTALGWRSMWLNTTGYSNTAVGSNSLNSNTNGWANVACGFQTLYNTTTGIGNTAIGYWAGLSNTTGLDNTTVGNQSLYSAVSSSGNTALGTFALANNVTGNNNTALGKYAGGAVGFNPSNFSALGYLSGYVGTNSNTIELGNTSVSWIGGQVGFFNYSDGRIKKNVQGNVPGLAFIRQLRPVTYNFDIQKQNEIVYKGVELSDWEGKYDLEQELQTGFIAQEVEEAAKKLGYYFNGVRTPKHEKDLYSIQYASFVVPLVKAVQEQQELIEKQQTKIQNLENRLQALEVLLNK